MVRRMIIAPLAVLNILAFASTAIALLAPYVPPHLSTIPSFLELGFIPLIVLIAGLTIAWIFIKPVACVPNLLLMLAAMPTINAHYASGSEPLPYRGEKSLTVLSFNVRLFDLYNWSNNNKTRDRILAFIDSVNADVICLQEHFNSSSTSYFNTLDTLLKVLPEHEAHEEFTSIMHGGLNKFGIATLSRYPIVNKGKIPFDSAGNNSAIYTDILFEGQVVRIINAHLASVHITEIQPVLEPNMEQIHRIPAEGKAGKFINRLKAGFRRRELQTRALASFACDSHIPTIIGMDLNDTPGSYSYNLLRQCFEDAFLSGPRGLGATYQSIIPWLRIDYIFYNDFLKPVEFKTINASLSDHRPIFARFVPDEMVNQKTQRQ
ncbi:MAG: endonuclease/exonuclease/phosphatase family protein [Salibacteraceae bacterium]